MRRLAWLFGLGAAVYVCAAQTDLIAYQSLYDPKSRQWLTPAPAQAQVVERKLRIRYVHLGRFEIEDEYRLRNPQSHPQRLQLAALTGQGAIYTQPPVELDGALLEWRDAGSLMRRAVPDLPNEQRYDVVERVKADWRAWARPFIQRLFYLDSGCGARHAVYDAEDQWYPNILTFHLTLPPNATRRLVLRYTVRSFNWFEQQTPFEALMQGDHLNYMFAPRGIAKDVPVRVRIEVAQGKAVRMSPQLQPIGVQSGYTVYESLLQRPDQILLVGGTPQELRSFYLSLEGLPIDVSELRNQLYYYRRVQQIGDDYYAPAHLLNSDFASLTGQGNRYQVRCGDVTLQFTIGARQATLNGKAITLSAPPRLVDGELLLPLREFLYLGWHALYAYDMKIWNESRDEFYRVPEPVPPPALEEIEIRRRPDSPWVEVTLRGRAGERQD